MIYFQPVSVRPWSRTWGGFNTGCQYVIRYDTPDVVERCEARIKTCGDAVSGRTVIGKPDVNSPLARTNALDSFRFGFGSNLGRPLAVMPPGVAPPLLKPPLRHEFKPLKRPKGTYKAFVKAKEAGLIVVNDRRIWKSEILDFVIPDESGSWSSDIYNHCNEDPDSIQKIFVCNGRDERSEVYPGIGFSLPLYNEHNAYSTSMNYRYKTNTSPTTLLTQYPNIGFDLMSIISMLDHHPLDTELVTSANAEFRSDIYDLLTELGELPETVSFLYSGVKAILTSYLDVKRRVKRLQRDKTIPVKDMLDRIASLWMGYRYGVMPIVYSVNDALDLLRSKSNIFITHRSGKNIVLTPDSSEANFWSAAPFEVRDRMWIKGSVDPTVVMRGFKFNVASTAWELVPLSFVVDWALNIGDVLSSLSTPAGLQHQAASYSRSFKGTVVLTNKDGIRCPVRLEYYNLRSINPQDHIGLSFNPNMTWKRSLDALALAWFGFKALFLKGK